MDWYIVQVKQNKAGQLMTYLNQEKQWHAFIPRIEKWFSSSQTKAFLTQEMYPGYLLIKTELDRERFQTLYTAMMPESTFSKLQEIEVRSHEADFFTHFFNEEGILCHSAGMIENHQLRIFEGPLMGMEQHVIKINRHKRTALLDAEILGSSIIVPLEIVSKH